ncbi:MAG: Heat-inducible transcription repressor hrcA, partial [Parcubacteria group bacterium GW2011_GWA1_Parcubacteria_45_10]
GRVPADKGYRFVVNELMKKEGSLDAAQDKQGKELMVAKDGADDVFKFIQNLTRQLAHESRALALNYFEDEDIFWKEGWEELLQEPEFGERACIINFTELLKDFEAHIEDIGKTSGVNVYIGKENRSPKAKDFTVISSHYKLSGGEEGVISILGPKRMEYDKNIELINSLMRMLGNY